MALRLSLKKGPTFKKTVESIVAQKKAQGDKKLDLLLRTPESRLTRPKSLSLVSKEENQYKAKTDLVRVDELRKEMVAETIAETKKRFGDSTLIQIKFNERDPNAPKVPNSLPRKSSVLGMINAFKKEGITQFALAVTDIKTGRLMGYTVIRIPKAAGEMIKKRYRSDLERSNAESQFLGQMERIIGQGQRSEEYYEEALKGMFGFQIKHLVMPGHIIDPITRDFRVKTLKDSVNLVKNKIVRVAEKIDKTSMHPKLSKNK